MAALWLLRLGFALSTLYGIVRQSSTQFHRIVAITSFSLESIVSHTQADLPSRAGIDLRSSSAPLPLSEQLDRSKYLWSAPPNPINRRHRLDRILIRAMVNLTYCRTDLSDALCPTDPPTPYSARLRGNPKQVLQMDRNLWTGSHLRVCAADRWRSASRTMRTRTRSSRRASLIGTHLPRTDRGCIPRKWRRPVWRVCWLDGASESVKSERLGKADRKGGFGSSVRLSIRECP